MRPILLLSLLLLAPGPAPAQPPVPTPPPSPAPAPSPAPSPTATPDARVRDLMDTQRWQPDGKRRALQVELVQFDPGGEHPEARLSVSDPATPTATARLYERSFPDASYLGQQALPAALREHDLLFTFTEGGQDRYLALTWSGGQVLEALDEFSRERPEQLQGKDGPYLLFNLLDPGTFGSNIYRVQPGRPYECVLRCVPFAQRFEALNQYLREHGAFIDGQSVSPCGPDHP